MLCIPVLVWLRLVYALSFAILGCDFHKGEIQLLHALQCPVIECRQINVWRLNRNLANLVLFHISLVFKEHSNECYFILIKNMQMT